MLRLNFGVDCDNLFYRTQKGSVFNGFRLSKRRFSVVPVAAGEDRPLSKIELQRLAEVPPEAEWFGNLTNENTKRAYRHDVTSFMRFVGIKRPEDFRTVARAHVIAWRKMLEKRNLAPATVRRKLSALSDLYDYLCEKNAVADNPVRGVERPKEGANEGKTPALYSVREVFSCQQKLHILPHE